MRPVLDFAHMHATSDGAFTSVEPFAEALAKVDAVLEPGAPFHIHFSDIQYANRNETKHLSYGEGTLRAEPLAEALARFERPATVISESPDARSSQAIMQRYWPHRPEPCANGCSTPPPTASRPELPPRG